MSLNRVLKKKMVDGCPFHGTDFDAGYRQAIQEVLDILGACTYHIYDKERYKAKKKKKDGS